MRYKVMYTLDGEHWENVSLPMFKDFEIANAAMQLVAKDDQLKNVPMKIVEVPNKKEKRS
jgi:hypothetical protein